jgi:hypothetical protein
MPEAACGWYLMELMLKQTKPITDERARISEAYRGKYLDSAGSNGNIGAGYEATNNVDFTAHFNFTPHPPVGHDLRILRWDGGRGCEPRPPLHATGTTIADPRRGIIE